MSEPVVVQPGEGRTVRIGPNEITYKVGGFVFVPRDCKFAWANPDDAPAHVLFVYSPAGFENYFSDLEAVIRANPDKTIPELMPQVMPLWQKYKIAREQ